MWTFSFLVYKYLSWQLITEKILTCKNITFQISFENTTCWKNILIKSVNNISNNISSLQKQLAEKHLMFTNTACWKSTQACGNSLLKNISCLWIQLAEKHLTFTNTACCKSTQVCRNSLLKNISIKLVNNISSLQKQLAEKHVKFAEYNLFTNKDKNSWV